ncbi:hypothetical protein [Nonomuraea solani]|nr:hypothetical protein [Nonomuraea solani]
MIDRAHVLNDSSNLLPPRRDLAMVGFRCLRVFRSPRSATSPAV